MLNAISKVITKWFAPYTVMYIDTYGKIESHHSWTFKDAVEWAACSLREEEVVIYKYHNLAARRSEVVEA